MLTGLSIMRWRLPRRAVRGVFIAVLTICSQPAAGSMAGKIRWQVLVSQTLNVRMAREVLGEGRIVMCGVAPRFSGLLDAA